MSTLFTLFSIFLAVLSYFLIKKNNAFMALIPANRKTSTTKVFKVFGVLFLFLAVLSLIAAILKILYFALAVIFLALLLHAILSSIYASFLKTPKR